MQSIDADGVYFNGAGPAINWNVFIYANNGTLPGAQVYSTLNQPVTQVGTTFTVNLTPAGRPHLRARIGSRSSQHGLSLRRANGVGLTAQCSPNLLRLGKTLAAASVYVRRGCQSWRSAYLLQAAPTRCTGLTGPRAPAEGTPTPTPTGTPAGCTTYTTATGTGTITPGDTDTGNHCDDCATPIPSRSRSAFTGRPLTARTSARTAASDLTGNSAAFTHGCLVLPNSVLEHGHFPVSG